MLPDGQPFYGHIKPQELPDAGDHRVKMWSKARALVALDAALKAEKHWRRQAALMAQAVAVVLERTQEGERVTVGNAALGARKHDVVMAVAASGDVSLDLVERAK